MDLSEPLIEARRDQSPGPLVGRRRREGGGLQGDNPASRADLEAGGHDRG